MSDNLNMTNEFTSSSIVVKHYYHIKKANELTIIICLLVKNYENSYIRKVASTNYNNFTMTLLISPFKGMHTVN